MNRRELLRLTCGALFAPLLKWLPKEKVVVGIDAAQDKYSATVAFLRQLPCGDVRFRPWHCPDTPRLDNSLLTPWMPRFIISSPYDDWETFKYRATDLSIGVTPLDE